ncbi:helix-turn-helix domain-containing protein [Streptomyces sp. NPDC051020]|uniref:TetR/AcrR family transcriptional regulator n=1 Tax=Streptomyces sp. NPDC051020 TaxID=3155409 RepID=UPI00341BF674
MAKGATRERIKHTALALFLDHGYDRTSLREIAEHLGVTKAAVYHHFKTKDDIVTALFVEGIRPVEDVIAWAQTQPADLSTRQEALRRYAEALGLAAPLVRFLQENQATLRGLAAGAAYRDVMLRASALFRVPGAGLTDQLRCVTAALIVHGVPAALADTAGGMAELRAAALAVGLELLAAAHSPRPEDRPGLQGATREPNCSPSPGETTRNSPPPAP